MIGSHRYEGSKIQRSLRGLSKVGDTIEVRVGPGGAIQYLSEGEVFHESMRPLSPDATLIVLSPYHPVACVLSSA